MTRSENRYASSVARSSSPSPSRTIPLMRSAAMARMNSSSLRTSRVRNHGSTTLRSRSWRGSLPSIVKGSKTHMKSSPIWRTPGGSHGAGSRENASSRLSSARMTSS